MKKSVLFLILAATLSFGLNAQTIENFESIKMNIFSGGTNGTISVVPNPDPSGINTSGYVGKMIRGWDGDPWAGWYATLDTPVDVTANKYVHLKIWKPRFSPVVFKYEGTNGNSGDVYPINPQALVNEWEELVFDMSMVSGPYVKIVLIPDFENPLTLTEDIVLYFDDLFVNNDPTVGSAAVQVMEDYEHIQLNLLLGGAEDQSSMTKVVNPDQSGINLSQYVIKFLRDKDGVPWGGFWSSLAIPVDLTVNKYIHVKVWKPRISPIKFKIEGGAAGTIEIESMYPQTMINAWEDIVFDFSDKTGTYPIIAFLPDFMDPVGLTEDITIYFDDIIVNNDPNPIGPPSQTISVDMTESGMTPGSQVWISGTMGGIHGTWNEPGTNPNNEMLDSDGDGIYSITMSLPDGLIAFKFFWGIGWDNGDPAPGGNRTLMITNTMNVFYKWGIDGMVGISTIEFNVNLWYQTLLGNFNPDLDYVDIVGTFNGWNGTNHHLIPIGGGMYTIMVENFTIGETIEYKFRINGDWATSEFPGGTNRTFTVLPGFNEITVWYNDEIPPSPGDVILADFEDGTWGSLTANTMGCGSYDYLPLEETFTIVDNPDPTGVNTSSKVCKFRRWGTNYGASTWGGFWANVFPEVDVNINKFVSVKVWKPRISPIRFKLEAGTAGTMEIESMAPQTLVNEWEEITFDFSSLWGTYPIAVFLPDYEDPLTVTDYLDLYFDDIVVGDVVTKIDEPETHTFNIYPNPVSDNLFVSSVKEFNKIEIHDVTGRLVKSYSEFTGIDQVQINTHDLKSGMYILTIYSGISSSSSKLMKY